MATIKELREKSGLTQAEFAREYSLSLYSLRRWEQNVTVCPVHIIELVSLKMENKSKYSIEFLETLYDSAYKNKVEVSKDTVRDFFAWCKEIL